MLKSSIALCSLGLLAHAAPAFAQSTVECNSVHYQYSECYAPLSSPQLVHQISSSACIVNRTWGFNRATQRIWVSEGCSAVFADVGGYHHGRGGTFDAGGRSYDHHGHDTGALIAGAIIGAAIAGSAKENHKHHDYGNYNYTSNTYAHGGYDGCHGVGCLVDPPGDDPVDTRPSFDKNGEPNFDTQGNYIGCHGVGCDVDPPDDASDDNN